MKHLPLFMGFLLILFSAGGCGGQSKAGINSVIYYIDPSSASNRNGSEASPYNTFSGVTFEPGAEYRIKRGSILYEEILVDVSCNIACIIFIIIFKCKIIDFLKGKFYKLFLNSQ